MRALDCPLPQAPGRPRLRPFAGRAAAARRDPAAAPVVGSPAACHGPGRWSASWACPPRTPWSSTRPTTSRTPTRCCCTGTEQQ
ncbi:hypothetical protein QJS66_08185 [Kocuria rhizophila]|nr:hypothetical protein QJS66_08185 [Kocuria rhizophila]